MLPSRSYARWCGCTIGTSSGACCGNSWSARRNTKSGVLRPPVAPVRQQQQKAASAFTEAAWNCGLRGHGLLGDLVGTLPGGILGGLNRQPGLAAQETDEAAPGLLPH